MLQLNMRILTYNILQGFVYSPHKHTFNPNAYIQFIKEQNPDIVFLNEVLIDTPNLTPSPKSSNFIETLLKNTSLNYAKVLSSEKSWISKQLLHKNKYYGLAIISKFPIEKYETLKLPNPKFEIDRPNGEHWILHDKFIQHAIIKFNKTPINLINLQFFPLHVFNKTFNDPAIKKAKTFLTNYLLKQANTLPTIIAGDFNNKNIPLSRAFPKLLNLQKLQEAIITKTTSLHGTNQLDHILYTPKHLNVKNGQAIKHLSDHYALVVDLELKEQI